MPVKNNLKFEGLLIASVSASGYWMSYLFQRGYCAYFNIPTNFIEVNIESILISVTGLLSSFGIFVLMMPYLSPIWRKIHVPLTQSFLRTVVFCLIAYGLSIVYKWPEESFWLVIGLLIMYLTVIEVLIPYFSHRDIEGFANKVAAENELIVEDAMLREFGKKFGHNSHLYIIAFSLLSFAIFVGGAISAKNTKHFITLNESSVVLKSVNGYFLIADVDRISNEISADYELVNIENFKLFSYENIGGLVVLPLASTNKNEEN